MKVVIATIAGTAATLSFVTGTAIGGRVPPTRAAIHAPVPGARGISTAALTEVVHRYCSTCHNDNNMKGNLSLDGYDVGSATDNVATSEIMIRKMRADIMPPPGSKRPGGDTLTALVETIEQVIDKGSKPNPGSRTFQRLNRAEYENAIRDLLALQVDAGDYLPLDTKSANFDNIADVQALSPTLVESYLNAASAIATMAVGDRKAPLTQAVYKTSAYTSQHPWDHADGTPFGTRGGLAVDYAFPADGMYEFRANVGGGVGLELQDMDISIDGARVALLHYERGMNTSVNSAEISNGQDYVRSAPIMVHAGQQRVSAAFVRRSDGPYEDLIKPYDWSEASDGHASAGTTEPPRLLDLTIIGPEKITGLSETPSRKIIFSCHPSGSAAVQRSCADQIITRLGTKAYRAPLTTTEKRSLMQFYDRGSAQDGFEGGVRMALQAMLSSPHFVFRFESTPSNAQPGQDVAVSDIDLASRLSFFLWGSIPDDQLLTLAEQHKLSQPKVLEAQVHRMLADPRSEALSTRFAAQWLRLQDLDKVHPDRSLFPDFSELLSDDMRRETEMFFDDAVKHDRSFLYLFTADSTFVNERLARHYGIRHVAGEEFRKVALPDDSRRGLLGQGSVLVQTSVADRTSPVLRGKWVMQVLIGAPPPPPPPDVPSLDETAAGKTGHVLTTRERMEIHRHNATCYACHQYMDPIGLALDNFDVTGKWRYLENGVPLDTRGTMYDGSPVNNPAELRAALLKRPIPLVRSFTENLMAYAVGRRMEDFDQPAIRAISQQAETQNYRLSSFVMGVVNSAAFREKRIEAAAAASDKDSQH